MVELNSWDSGFQGCQPSVGEAIRRNSTPTIFEMNYFRWPSGIPAGTPLLGFNLPTGTQCDDTRKSEIVDLGFDKIFNSSDDTTLFSQEFTTEHSAWGFL